MSRVKETIRKTVALVSMFAFCCALGQSLLPVPAEAQTTPSASTQVYETQFIAQGIVIVNSTVPTAAQLTQLATTLSNYITSATADGSLAAAQASLAKNAQAITAAITAAQETSTIYGLLSSYGFTGTQSQVTSWMDAVNAANGGVPSVSSVVAQINSQGLAAMLQQGVTALQDAAVMMSMQKTGASHLIEADYKLGAKLRLVAAACYVLANTAAWAGLAAVIAGFTGDAPMAGVFAVIGAGLGVAYAHYC